MIALGEADVYIWFRSTAPADCTVIKLADQSLSIEERTRRDRFRFEPDRREFTFGHDLLRRSLSRCADVPPADWRFTVDDHGKPSIANVEIQRQALSFSLSHTPGCVACAIASNAPLGVDVEQINQSRHIKEVADRYFSEREVAALRQCADDERPVRFFELWTLKEAFLKAIGVGLSGTLTDISFHFDEHGHILFSGPPTVDPRDWHFVLFEPLSNVRLAIAIHRVVRPKFFLQQDDDNGHMFVPVRVSAPPKEQLSA